MISGAGLARHDLDIRILAVALLPMLLATGLFALYFIQREIGATETALLERGRGIARHLSDATAFDLFSGNHDALQRLLDYERSARDAVSLILLNVNHEPILLSGLPPRSMAQYKDGGGMEWQEGGQYHFFRPVSLGQGAADEGDGGSVGDPFLLELAHQSAVVGYIHVALSAESVQLARAKVLRVSLGIAALLMLLGGLLAWRLSRGLSRPLDAAIAGVRRFAAGHYGARLDEDAPGELGELQRNLNRMAERLQSHTGELEQRIHSATSDLNAQRLAAESAVQAKSRFLAAASHDLRQPLHALILLVAALRDRLPANQTEAQRLVYHIEASAAAMEKMLNALLHLSSLEAGTVTPKPECMALRPLFARLRQSFGPMAAEKGLRLKVFDSAASVHGDPVLIERILANLLTNAIRYTARGGVLLGVRRVGDGRLWLCVYDTGIGIEEAYRERIFEEYFQLDNVERDRDKGLGLGLAIVRRLSALIESPVRLRSTPDVGSCFAVELQRCEVAVEVGDAIEETEQVDSERPILVCIDDDEAILDAMAAVTELWGLELAAGTDAEAVIADLESLGRRPDVILCDYRLRNGQSGIDAIRCLRAHFGGDIAAALITGDTSAESLQTITQAGLPLLHKPIKPARLRAFINQLRAVQHG